MREQELSRAIRKHPSSMTAYDLTLQALDQIYRVRRESLVRARELLDQAIAHDPTYAPAYSHSAYVHSLWIGQGRSHDITAVYARAARAAEMAIEHDRNDAMALAVYGHTQSFLRKDYDTALVFLDRAVAAGPSCAWAWSMNSFTCQFVGDTQNAIPRAEQAVRLSPIGPDAFWHEHALSQAHYMSGNYGDAISWARMSAAHNGGNLSNVRSLIAVSSRPEKRTKRVKSRSSCFRATRVFGSPNSGRGHRCGEKSETLRRAFKKGRPYRLSDKVGRHASQGKREGSDDRKYGKYRKYRQHGQHW